MARTVSLYPFLGLSGGAVCPLASAVSTPSKVGELTVGLGGAKPHAIFQRPRVLRRRRRVLVIGGAGYIGSVLCGRLLAEGYQVRVLDVLFYGDESLRDLRGNDRFELRIGDSRDITALVGAMRDVEAVVQLGEIVGDPACGLDERTTRDINLGATLNAAKVAKGMGVQRFVYASSCSVYGASDELLTERSPLNPLSVYARAKIGSERGLLDLRDADFHPVILRLATVFGMSPRPRFDLVVNLFTARAVVEGKITVIGGSQWRPFIHVSDVARAISKCLRRPLTSVDGQTFNVGSNRENHTIQEIGEVIRRSVPQASLEIEDTPDPRNYRVSFDKIRAVLGFEPQISVARGVAELRDALRAGVVGDYRSPEYSNVRALGRPSGNTSLRAKRVDYFREQVPVARDLSIGDMVVNAASGPR
jgi:nucleoside-diphosphate-sugar epimerase